MCMQCMATAMTTGAAATGIRAWLATRGYAWLTPTRLRRATICLFAAALIASAVVISGSGATSQAPAADAVSAPAASK